MKCQEGPPPVQVLSAHECLEIIWRPEKTTQRFVFGKLGWFLTRIGKVRLSELRLG